MATHASLAATLADSRFGYGRAPNAPLAASPAAMLKAQLDRYDLRPESLSATPASPDLAARLAELQRTRNMQQLRELARTAYATSAAARVATAATSPAPFAERLVHFWANHFTVSADRPQTLALAGPHEFEAIRPHILGRFEDMLLASTRHPGMLLYLDQARSIGPGSQQAGRQQERGRRAAGLNENLAREILELHTLGVDGGYTQADVTELARALTGWTVSGPADAAPGSFRFRAAAHQPGDRQLLGRGFAAAGETQARDMLVMLARHPATARHLSVKLARHFVADNPPEALVARLTGSYLESGGDLAALYRTLIASPEAWAPQQAKFKTPWDWTISTLRLLDMTALPGRQGVTLFAELGQPLWRPGSPAGWPDTTADWAAPDALFRRVEAASRLARLAPGVDARALAEAALPGLLSAETAGAISRAEDGPQALALLLVSPEFLRR